MKKRSLNFLENHSAKFFIFGIFRQEGECAKEKDEIILPYHSK